ncbi:hypothetical protein C8R45DRAFT_66784 [Mycena sanguinolenta]|nr:hypothetical protein C8R45DRAFT_66784 [Mycena sanguinolenta]
MDSTPSYDPPAYDEARLPLNPVNYEFSPHGFNTLLLLPPSNLPDSRALYHISVAMNCLNPLSFITTLHKGASNSGPYVGEFEMGISTIPGTVVMGDCQKRIRDVVHSIHRSRWTWTFRADRSQHIRWELPNSSTGIFNPPTHILHLHTSRLHSLKELHSSRRAPNALRHPCCESIQQGRPYLMTSFYQF